MDAGGPPIVADGKRLSIDVESSPPPPPKRSKRLRIAKVYDDMEIQLGHNPFQGVYEEAALRRRALCTPQHSPPPRRPHAYRNDVDDDDEGLVTTLFGDDGSEGELDDDDKRDGNPADDGDDAWPEDVSDPEEDKTSIFLLHLPWDHRLTSQMECHWAGSGGRL